MTRSIRRQRRLADPLIDLRLFGERTFSVSVGALTSGAVVLTGISYLTAQYRRSPLRSVW